MLTRQPGVGDRPLDAPAGRRARSTQRPSGTIRPVSSASGMNASGRTRPRCGCIQRTSASTPDDAAGRQSRRSAGSAGRTRRRRGRAAGRPAGRGGAARPRACAARTRRSGPCRRSWHDVHRDVGVAQQLLGVDRPRWPATAMPMLAWTNDLLAVDDAAAAPSARMMRSTTCTADCSLGRSTEHHRELVAAEPGGGVAGAHQARSRSATARSIESPAACPSPSLTVLKSSRSRSSTARVVASRSRRASACATRSVNRARLASPVSSSWNAAWRSCISNCLRSPTSRTVTTVARTFGSARRLLTTASASSQPPVRRRRRSSSRRLTPGLASTSVRPDWTRSRSSGWQQVLEAAPDQGAGWVAEHPLHRRALVGDRRVPVHQQDRVRGVLHQGAEPGLALPHVQVGGEGGRLQGQRELGHQGEQRVGPARVQRPGGHQDDEGEQLVVDLHGAHVQPALHAAQAEADQGLVVQRADGHAVGGGLVGVREQGARPAPARGSGPGGGCRRRPARPRRRT